MKILITGAAGFLGYHLVSLLQEKHELTLVDIHPTGPDNRRSAKYIQMDVNDKGIFAVVQGQDVVIHAAAALPLWKKKAIFATNVDGTENILSASQAHHIKRFIYVSSTAVYGIPEKHPILETDPLVGVGPYGESKILAEKLCLDYMTKGLNVTIVRPKTFLGTGRLGVFEILFDWIHDGKKIPVIGNGKNRYQLLAVDDLADVIGRFAEGHQTTYNGVFNVAAEEFRTVKEDLEAVFDFAKTGSTVMATPAPLVKGVLQFLEFLNLSPLYQWVYGTADKDSFVSIDKLKTVLGWQPKYSNAQILIKTYEWYKQNYAHIKSQQAGITHTAAWKQGALGWIKKFL